MHCFSNFLVPFEQFEPLPRMLSSLVTFQRWCPKFSRVWFEQFAHNFSTSNVFVLQSLSNSLVLFRRYSGLFRALCCSFLLAPIPFAQCTPLLSCSSPFRWVSRSDLFLASWVLESFRDQVHVADAWPHNRPQTPTESAPVLHYDEHC